ncbi:MAG: hypothetical protein N3E37_05110, partial [Candidatus Micrarchaeota archaeon]|nr:hypothetical protein [Candidatus Micrarchaeota archaeon]
MRENIRNNANTNFNIRKSANNKDEVTRHERLLNFLRHHDCSGCSGCGLKEHIEKKRAELLGNEPFQVISSQNNTDLSSTKKKADLIDDILSSKRTTNSITNNNSEYRLNHQVHESGCSCPSCSAKNNNIEEIFNIINKKQTLLEDRVSLNNDSVNSSARPVIKHDDDCTCSSCTSKRQHIDDLFNKLNNRFLQSETLASAETIDREVSGTSKSNVNQRSGNSLLYNYNKSSDYNNNYIDNLTNQTKISATTITKENKEIVDYYSKTTHAYKITIGTDNLLAIKDKKKSDQETFETLYVQGQNNSSIKLNNNGDNYSSSISFYEAKSTNLFHNKNDSIRAVKARSGLPTLEEVLAIAWLRKLYGHLYGLTDSDDLLISTNQRLKKNHTLRVSGTEDQHLDSFKKFSKKLEVYSSQITTIFASLTIIVSKVIESTKIKLSNFNKIFTEMKNDANLFFKNYLFKLETIKLNIDKRIGEVSDIVNGMVNKLQNKVDRLVSGYVEVLRGVVSDIELMKRRIIRGVAELGLLYRGVMSVAKGSVDRVVSDIE